MANNTKKLVHGVGINNLPYPIKHCPFYERWRSMLCRCYSSKFHLSNTSYENCYVCEEWKYDLNFKTWMEKQEWQGKVLDKDIIFPGNKIYSPETCIFVSVEINLLVVKNKKNRIYPLGVYKSSTSKKFDSKIRINGKSLFLGSYCTLTEAHREWQKFRIYYLKKVASQQIDDRLKDALINIANIVESDYIAGVETKYT